MKNTSKIAVIGGTGKSGKYLVQQLINQDYHFKILVRNPENFTFKSRFIEMVHGDINDYETVKSILKDCSTVISTLGIGIPHSAPTIFSTATRHVIRAMNELEIKRYIVVTGLNVDTPLDKKNPQVQFGTDWMYKNYPKSTTNRQEEYQLLVESTLDWTLVRLPMILLNDEQKVVVVSLEDCLGDSIGATDLAQFLIKQIQESSFVKQAPFIANAQ